MENNDEQHTGIKIEGGYYLKARCIQNSDIAHAPPHVREIWDWLIKEANYKDIKKYGIVIKRGQCLRSYDDILEGLHWTVGWRKERYKKHQCENAMKWLKKAEMIATKKTAYGLLITIINYNTYQNPSNYESHNVSHRSATMLPQSSHTFINKKDKKEKKHIPPISPLELKNYLAGKIAGNGLEKHTEKLFEFIDYRMAKTVVKERYKTTRGIDTLLTDVTALHDAGLDVEKCLDYTIGRNWLSPPFDHFIKNRKIYDTNSGKSIEKWDLS